MNILSSLGNLPYQASGPPAEIDEGKPENQNHAIILTCGEALQTIVMNQVCNSSSFP